MRLDGFCWAHLQVQNPSAVGSECMHVGECMGMDYLHAVLSVFISPSPLPPALCSLAALGADYIHRHLWNCYQTPR